MRPGPRRQRDRPEPLPDPRPGRAARIGDPHHAPHRGRSACRRSASPASPLPDAARPSPRPPVGSRRRTPRRSAAAMAARCRSPLLARRGPRRRARRARSRSRPSRSSSSCRSRRADRSTSSGRLIAQKLTEAWGQSVVVENKPGAGGNIGADARRQVAAGRLHDRDGRAVDARGQPEPVREDALRRGRRTSRRSRWSRSRPTCWSSTPSLPVNSVQGPHRLRQGESRASSPSARAATAAPATSPASCSRSRPAPTSSTSRSRAARRRRRRCSPATRSSCSTTSPTRWRR